MKKKIIFNTVVILGGLLLVIAGLMLTMVVAPGADILGFAYVRTSSGSVNETQSLDTKFSPISRIEVNCDNAPIAVEFVQSYTFSVVLDEKINGFVKVNKEEECVKLSAKDGVATFNVVDYNPLIFHVRQNDFGVVIKVPMYYAGNVVVNSKRSNITVNGHVSACGLGSLTLKTTGKVNIFENLFTKNLILDVASKSVSIKDGAKITGDLTVKSKGAKVLVECDVAGKIDYTAKSGKLLFKSCGQLVANCGSANIGGVEKDNVPSVGGNTEITSSGNLNLQVFGDCKITQKNGKVKLGEEGKTYAGNYQISSKNGNVNLQGKYAGNVAVLTKAGDIYADQLAGANITTHYGKIEVKSGQELQIDGGNSDIIVKKCSKSLTVNARSGNILLGDKESVFSAKLQVKTYGGNVKIVDLAGSSSIINTDSGNVDISISKDGVPKLDIKTVGGDVNVDNLKSACVIASQGKINVNIEKLTAPVTIMGHNKNVKVQVSKTSKITLKSQKDNKISAFGETISGKEYSLNSNRTGKNELNISTNRGKIVLFEENENK